MRNKILLLLLYLAALATPALAERNVVESAIDKAIDAGFSELERELIAKYYKKTQQEDEAGTGKETTQSKKARKGRKSKKGLPPGLAKRDSLPPGLEKQLQKNGELPPGLAKRGLPDDLEESLPPVKEGHQRQVVEDAVVVLVNKATGKVVDIIKDAIIPGARD